MIETYVVYHKDDNYINMDHIHPILVGCEKRKIKNSKLLCDNIGDNISSKNAKYNELTAIYWLWKHYDEIGNPDYIGIQHYRRFFYTADTKYSYFEVKSLDEKVFSKIVIDDKTLKIFDKYDFIVPCPIKVSTVCDQFKAMHGEKGLKLVMDIILNKYPDYVDACHDYILGSTCYLYNMFVFDKETFFRYCDWMFDILKEYETKSDDDRLYVSERLTGIFITKLIMEGKKPYNMPIIYISGPKASLKESIKQSKNYYKSGKGIKYIIKPIVEKLMPKKLWILWKRKQFIR